MIAPVDAIDLCAAIYAGEAGARWDFFEPSDADEGVCWGLRRFGNVVVVAFRGSITIQDWIRDLLAITLPFSHSGLGPVHPGFLLGMPEAWAAIKAQLRPGDLLVLTGHSLGAARAAICCGLAKLDGVVAARKVLFGCPRPGFEQLADLCAATPEQSFCNGDERGHDLVTDVPIVFGIERYTRSSILIPVSASPAREHFDQLDAFSYHHVALYQRAIRSAVPAGAA